MSGQSFLNQKSTTSNLMEEVKTNGWNMLDSYKEGQAIYGRDEEIESISESILYNVQTFVYGKSGIGKTSLLQAGIFPVLRKNHYFPVIIRLAFYEKETLTSVVKNLVFEEAKTENLQIGKLPLNFHPIDNSDISDCSLQTFFSKVKFEDESDEPYIPVLIFDQFEETINNEDNWQRTVDFLKNDLYDLLDNSSVISGETLPYTNYRIVISMREDYLYCLEDIVDRFSLWELRYNRFRVKALNDEKATEVIRKTFGANCLEEGKVELIVNTIIRIVKLNSGTRFTEINTALLSLICSLLHENSEDACVRYKDLRNINSYLRSYYDDICKEIGSGATHYLESHLLTKDGRRSSVDESEAINSGKIKQEALDYLVEKRLLRRVKTDNTSNRYEYIHDLFAKMVYKRLQEDKSQWFYPELRTLSKKEDRSTSLRKILITSLSVIGICCGILTIHFITTHDTWEFWDFTICRPNLFYFMPFALSVYLLSLVVKRLHDINKSGWLCFMIPLSVFFINAHHFIPALDYTDIASEISMLLGYLLIGYLVFLCLRPSISSTKPRGFSRVYEEVFNMAKITNIEFIKSISLEFVWWCICCCITDMMLLAYFDHDTWRLFCFKQDAIILDKLGMIKSFPAVLSLLPIIICLSPALRARVKSLGYPVWISYIPYFNFLLLLIGLLPNKILMNLRLLRENKNNQQQESDNIFAEITDDFTVNEDILYTNHLNERLNGNTVLFMLLVPLYGTIKGLDKSQKIGIRVSSISMGVLNASLIWGLFLYLSINGYIDSVTSDWLILILGIVIYIPLIGLFVLSRNLKKIIFCVIKEHPYYSINQIAHELVVKPSAIEKEINKMKGKGEIEHVEENGQLVWKVNESLKK